MIKYDIEFYYHNIEIKIFNLFGYGYVFNYAGTEYTSNSAYLTLDLAKEKAKIHADQILTKRKLGDDLEMNV